MRHFPEFHPEMLNAKCGTSPNSEIPHCNGAGDGTRTRTGLPPTVFKTVASAISPLRRAALIIARRLRPGNPQKLRWGHGALGAAGITAPPGILRTCC